MSRRPIKRYYVRKSIVPFEEDAKHEFKGHTNLSIEEIHPHLWIAGTDKRSRQPISKVLNAFLNTGLGGTTYIGILDDGRVGGISLTQYKKDHFKAAMDDLMRRYHPQVEEHRYKVRFIPVVDSNLTDDEIEQIATYDTSLTAVPEQRLKPHLLRTYKYCWCDKDAKNRLIGLGIVATDYVIEVVIKAWDPNHLDNTNAVGQMKTHPIHEDETGRSYFRRQGSVVQYNVQEQCHFSQILVDNKYGPEIEKVKKELEALWKSSKTRGLNS